MGCTQADSYLDTVVARVQILETEVQAALEVEAEVAIGSESHQAAGPLQAYDQHQIYCVGEAASFT